MKEANRLIERAKEAREARLYADEIKRIFYENLDLAFFKRAIQIHEDGEKSDLAYLITMLVRREIERL